MLQEELHSLQVKYKKREDESLTSTTIPDNNYLCIRLDGFNATKKHLKDKIVNNNFSKGLTDAHYNLFCSFRHLLNREYTSSIVCSFMANDEISIVLNKDNDNFDRRIMKLCSLFSGVMSSAATLTLNRNKKSVGVVAFDARPIILSSKHEIVEYIRSRYLISKRYAYWKALRLSGIDGVYEDEIKKNIDNAMNLAIENDLESQAIKIINTYKFFLPEQINKPKYSTITANDETLEESKILKMIDEYLDYLHSAKRESTVGTISAA